MFSNLKVCEHEHDTLSVTCKIPQLASLGWLNKVLLQLSGDCLEGIYVKHKHFHI